MENSKQIVLQNGVLQNEHTVIVIPFTALKNSLYLGGRSMFDYSTEMTLSP
jgi:hypothetical protein